MFYVFHLRGEHHCSRNWFQFAPSGIESIRFCEKHGLPASTESRFMVVAESITDRRAAESWPDALDYRADLPDVYVADLGRPCEFADMLAAGVLALAGPEKIEGDAVPSIRVKPTCSPFELVQWRRAWAAEQRAKEAEAEVAKFRALIDEDPEEEETE